MDRLTPDGEKVRLIDANAMREDWLENGENEYVYDTNAVLDSIDAQPTVDAVPVVRCKCCFYFDDTHCVCYNKYGLKNPKPDDFCSHGERKSNG